MQNKEFKNLKMFTSNNQPVYLYGPSGAGKGYAVRVLADELGLDFYFTGAVLESYSLTGFIDAKGEYVETTFYQAFTKGGIYFFDEMDTSAPEAIIKFNEAMANREVDFPLIKDKKGNVVGGGRTKAHPDFVVVAAGNTNGKGATNEYNGRSKIDAATMNRFALIEWDYDEEVEKMIINKNAPHLDAEEFMQLTRLIRKAALTTETEIIFSTRTIENITKIAGNEGHKLTTDDEKAEFGRLLLKSFIYQGLEENDLLSFKRYISDIELDLKDVALKAMFDLMKQEASAISHSDVTLAAVAALVNVDESQFENINEANYRRVAKAITEKSSEGLLDEEQVKVIAKELAALWNESENKTDIQLWAFAELLK